MSIIIDRRLNDRNKNTVNRERFLRRYKEQIRKSVADMVSKRSITDMDRGGDVSIPVRDISEPQFGHGEGGDRDIVLPGNHRFAAGDRLPRPDGGASGGGSGEGEGQGGPTQDDFSFSLSREEFLNLFFDDLELPHLIRNTLGDVNEYKLQRAGYTPSGVPANLSVARSLRQAMARRIALEAPLKRQLADLRQREVPPDEEIAELQRRIDRVPFLDEIDLRYRHRVKVPQPVSRAVMFCLMDVSASMSEDKKDLAKRFFTLLYLFLSRKYKRVELVFIRHTDNAQEVEEDAFFHDTQSGGTVVLSALKLMHEIVVARYPTEEWNIYGAQVSVAELVGADPEKSRACLTDQLLPLLRYFAYVEVPDDSSRISPLTHAYQRIDSEKFAMAAVNERGGVYPVLRELFRKEAA